MREKILSAAEKRVRAAGFAEMSFRDIASDIGIKSSSVHYHFPTKTDLGRALIEAYSKRFAARLSDIETDDLKAAVQSYISLYAEALVLDESICLCAIMGAEAIGLPVEINQITKVFFEMNLDWLMQLFSAHLGNPNQALASMIVSALDGAMIIASTTKNRSVFENVAEKIILDIDNLGPNSGE